MSVLLFITNLAFLATLSKCLAKLIFKLLDNSNLTTLDWATFCATHPVTVAGSQLDFRVLADRLLWCRLPRTSTSTTTTTSTSTTRMPKIWAPRRQPYSPRFCRPEYFTH